MTNHDTNSTMRTDENGEVPLCGCNRHEFDHYASVGCPA